MKRMLAAAAALQLCLLLSNYTFAQTSNASVGGFVQDPSGAYIPGVSVTATNTQTGIVSTVITNESGAYTIPSLLPGIYKLAAELPGFKTRVFSDVQLGANTAGRYNFTLDVGAASESVEVTAERTALIAESSPTIGQVLPEKQVRELPLVSTNVLDLINTMPGVVGGINSAATTFAGISAQSVNTTRDGLSVQEGRYAYGVGSTTLINPDMVGEFRVILAPVDAETGRGNGQVQIVTRSGTNQIRGSAVWNIKNSALNANTWVNNKQIIRGKWSPTQPNWQNENEYSVSLGGPVKKNKTFFFLLWDQQFERDRTLMRPIVLTDCARNGVFRYWDGYQNGNINTIASGAGTANPVLPSVDSFGSPVRPVTNPNGTPYTGQLRYFSVFGPLLSAPVKPDCSDANVQGTPWDKNRPGMDPVGISQRYLGYMPHANVFDGGDGLNTAINQWAFNAHGTGDLNTAYGTSFQADNHQINLKIDHNFNSRNKIAVNGSYQWVDNDYIPISNPTTQWPNGFLSKTIRRPRVLTVNLTSTLTSNLLNEARYGYRANWHYVWAPWEVPDVSARTVPLSLMLQGGQGVTQSGATGTFPIVYTPATVGGMTTVSFSCSTGCAQQGNNTPLFEYADTVSWTKGKHAFKGGVDFRFSYSRGYETPTAPIPKGLGGAGLNPTNAFPLNNANFPGLVSNNQTLANSLLYFLAGSVNTAQQYYHLYSPTDLQWGSYLDHSRRLTFARQNDFSWFFKDDWKVRPDFTLNLGMRYEWYGVPYSDAGLTPAPVGGGLAIFGVSGRGFDRWLRPDNPVDLSLQTKIELVGPNSPNPGKTIYNNDWKNFGPAVGFSWQLPWLGKGKTNIRGGYQISYVKPSNIAALVNGIFLNPGFANLAQTNGPTDGTYFDTRNLPAQIPITPGTQPLQPIPLTKPNQAISIFDTNEASPYIQNLTLSLTREISRNFSLDVRYIGTRGLKLDGNYDLNIPNVFNNPTLFNALESTRQGQNVALFDQMFLGLNLNPGLTGCNQSNPSATCGPVDGTTQRGSQALRLSSNFRAALANGDYNTVASALNIFNGTGSGAAGAVNGIAGERGTVLKRANLGFNVPGGNSGGTIPTSIVVQPGLFPANWITANPQVSNAFYYTNSGKSNYQSLQVQGVLRPTQGLNFTTTYVWSRALEVSASSYTNPADRDKDYILGANHYTHNLRANGSFAIPIGPNTRLFSNTPRWIARTIEGWQTSFILGLNTGNPSSITAGNMLYANGVPDIAGSFSAKPFGKTQWSGDFGNYFGNGTAPGSSASYGQVSDPQCKNIDVSIQPYCTLQAVTDAKSGQILLQNPQPGHRGTLGRQTMELPGVWSYDGALSKTLRLTESKSMQLRVDAIDVLNHPTPGSPTLNINGTTPFGSIQAKGNQNRQFKAQLRYNF